MPVILNGSNLLTKSQKLQVEKQYDRQKHEDFRTDILITPYGEKLEGFMIKKGVWNPTIVSARHHAAYLFYHNGLYRAKNVLDMGTGSGLMGVIMATFGAMKVTMVDISEESVENARINVEHFGLGNVDMVIKSDLFYAVFGKYDCITFMQPYFAGVPSKGDTIATCMLASPEMIRKFLIEARDHLNPGGIIIMPSYDLAGNINNPAAIGPNYGYKVTTPFLAYSSTGIQKGVISMHELRLD